MDPRVLSPRAQKGKKHMNDVQAAGQSGFLFVMLGVCGFLLSFMALLAAMTKPSIALRLAPFCLLLGAGTVFLGSRIASKSLEQAQAAADRAPTEEQRAEALKAGAVVAHGVQASALQAGGLPLLAGAGALVAAFLRRRKA
jgi:hypothetical protein